MGGGDGCEGSVKSVLSGLICEIVIHLARENLHLSGKSQGKVREFQKPLAVAAMIPFGAAHNCTAYIRK